MNKTEAAFAEQTRVRLEKFRKQMSLMFDELLEHAIGEYAFHAVDDATTNFKNHLRNQLTEEFRKTILTDECRLCWAWTIRKLLLENHKEELQNKIIRDLQAEVKYLQDCLNKRIQW